MRRNPQQRRRMLSLMSLWRIPKKLQNRWIGTDSASQKTTPEASFGFLVKEEGCVEAVADGMNLR